MLKTRHSILLLCTTLLFAACAKVIAPSGGPMDTEPPVVVIFEPSSGLTNFSDQTIEITFDEFFTLKSPETNIYLNPLTEDKIEYKIKGKRLLISLPDDMHKNLSYTLVLNNAIADFHEGNILKSLQYVFSTGTHFDSLSIQGRVINAATGEPLENIMIYLMPEDADSALLKKQFSRVAFSDIQGAFKFYLLPPGNYSLYALSDKDNSHTLNSIEEMPGFHSEIITVRQIRVNDSTVTNTLILDQPIRMFNEQDSVLKIIKFNRSRRGLQQIAFNMPVENPMVRIMDESVADSVFWFLNSTSDTLSIWFTGQKKDYARVMVSASGQTLDTLNLSLKLTGRGTSVQDNYLPPKLALINGFDDNHFHFQDTVIVRSSNPVFSMNPDSIFVISNNDTLDKKIIFQSNDPQTFRIVFLQKENTDYTVVFDRGAISDCFGLSNDSTQFEIKSTHDDYYGKLKIIFADSLSGCHCIEFFNTRKEVVYRHCYGEDEYQNIRNYDHLIPGDYFLKIFSDSNCNQQWDTGDFSSRKQPESSFRSSGRVIVKSGWETEITWSLY
jgi:uncharacterized protein (DUF2141 family)